MEANKTLNPIVPELFLRRRKVNISLVFKLQTYFKVNERHTLLFHGNS